MRDVRMVRTNYGEALVKKLVISGFSVARSNTTPFGQDYMFCIMNNFNRVYEITLHCKANSTDAMMLVRMNGVLVSQMIVDRQHINLAYRQIMTYRAHA